MLSILNRECGSRVKIGRSFLSDVGIGFFVDSNECRLVEKFITNDRNTIEERQLLFDAISQDSTLVSFFSSLRENIKNMNECKNNALKITSDMSSGETLFYSFREFCFFTESIDLICDRLSETKNPKLRELFKKADSVQQSEWYKNAKKYMGEMDEKLRDIRSVTIGMNLNAQLAPIEAGIISVDTEPCVTNTLFDKLFSSKSNNKNLICIAPLEIKESKAADPSLLALNVHLYQALNEILKGSLKKIRKILYKQFIESSEFLFELSDEIEFIDICNNYILSMKAKGLPLCTPTISEQQYISNLYNPELTSYKRKNEIVSNDVFFDNNGKLFILAGANSGGKSVYLRSVGIAQVLFQLGLPITAIKAEMIVFNEIYSCFRNNIKDKTRGSFESECRVISDICRVVSEKSLVLFDEVFSTTSSYDAFVVAQKIIEYFSKKGCCLIYATHIHELVESAPSVNTDKNAKSKVDFLSVEYYGGRRSYKIARSKCDYGSAAMDIFEKYSMEFLL